MNVSIFSIFPISINKFKNNYNCINWFQGPEITLLANAVHQLPVNSAIKIVLFKEKYQSKFLGDIVVVKTESIDKNPFHGVLEIKFERKYLFYSHAKWKCVYWDYKSKFGLLGKLFFWIFRDAPVIIPLSQIPYGRIWE